ncbi:MAG: PLP-dependent aminotransferase family protein [Desulfovibrionaceae bacterium]
MTIWNPQLPVGGGPIYRQIADAIERDVASGQLHPGERLPTHRDLADLLQVNVSTITRGYREAEKRGLLSGTVGRGTFVSSDAGLSSSIVNMEAHTSGMIELGLVTPMYHLDPDPIEALRKLAQRRDPSALMRYTDPRGLPEHREIGASWAGRYGLEADAEDVVVCAGAQHALTCCLISLFRAGDRIATEGLTYPGIKTMAAMLGLRLAPVALDEYGMIPEALDVACRRERIRGLYIMPGMHNPTTAGMPAARREELARVARRHGLTIIEDDAYDLTTPGGIPAVSSFLRDQSVYVAGVSKAFAPGLRVAFLVVPPRLRKTLGEAVLNTVWMAPPLSVELACHWIKDGTADSTIQAKRDEAAQRMDIVSEALSGLDWRGKPTGFFLWLHLPDTWTGKEFEDRARTFGLNVFGAEKFTVGDTPAPKAIRLSLTATPDRKELRRGLDMVAELARDRLPDILPVL